MARKKSGGLNKVLNFIGLVDDEPQDIYQEEYENDSYGRPQAYAPQRNQQRAQSSRSRQEVPVRRSSNAYEPTRAPRMSRNSNPSSRFDQPQRGNSQGARRPSAAQRSDNRSSGYDYSPRTSRFGEVPGENERYEEAPRSRGGQPRQRTVMFPLHSVEECRDVIDSLILNNTVILTLNELEPRDAQRAVDTISGAVFALRGTIRKASDSTYLVAPNGVEVDANDDFDRRF